ncbi:hypothetical protein ON010_g14804 [Phytophthora cinnamomi]|nr:hypothetical protein ON010_g14804 [Phytophthora cinnamomi]
MKALENRTLDSKREMDILDALDEIKAINQRHAKVDTDKLLQQHADEGQLSKEEQDRQLEEDRREAHRVFEERQKLQQEQNALKRPVGEGEEGVKPTSTSTGLASASGDSKAETATAAPLKLAVTVKKKTTVAAKKKKKAKAKAPAPPVASLVAEYSDSSDE